MVRLSSPRLKRYWVPEWHCPHSKRVLLVCRKEAERLPTVRSSIRTLNSSSCDQSTTAVRRVWRITGALATAVGGGGCGGKSESTAVVSRRTRERSYLVDAVPPKQWGRVAY